MATQVVTLPGIGRRPAEPASLSPRRERTLVRAAQRGDAAAVEALFRAHWPACHRAATLITRDAAAAEDIAQEAFLAAIAGLDGFDRDRPFGPWLRRIVANRAIDLVRRRAARREVETGPLDDHPADPAAGFSDELLAAVAGLPDEQRTVVVLRHLLELTPSEISVTAGVPVGTVNSRLRRGLDALHAVLRERGT